MRQVVWLAVVVIIVTFIVGVMIGRANSPDYNSKTESIAFLMSKAKVRMRTLNDITIDLDAGYKHYRYTYPDDKLVETPNLALLGSGHRPSRRWRTMEFDKLNQILGLSAAAASGAGVAAAAGGKALGAAKGDAGLASYLRETIAAESRATKRPDIVVASVVGGAIGGTAGYFVGYQDKQDYDAEVFTSVVEDKMHWRYLVYTALGCEYQLETLDKISRHVDVLEPNVSPSARAEYVRLLQAQIQQERNRCSVLFERTIP